MKEKNIFGYKPSYILLRPWMIVEQSWREIVYAWQRVFRGWDDRAVWSIDTWLSRVMPEMLRELKDCNRGISGSIIDKDFNDDKVDEYYEKWMFALDQIISGFTAANRIITLDYPCYEEIQKTLRERYPARMKFEEEFEKYSEISDELGTAEIAKKSMERDQKIFEDGMKIFTEHFFGLWW